jgi:hypothetical protein
MSEQHLTYNRFDSYSGSQITVWFGNILIDSINSIQWSRSQSKKPIYGYASQQFDAVAKGVVLVQGSFVINFKQTGFLSFVMDAIGGLYGPRQDPNQSAVVREMIGLHLKNGTFGPKTLEEINNIAYSPDFLELAKAYEDTIWGTEVSQTRNLSADTTQQDIIPDGFDILITYGNNSMNQKNTLQDYMQSTVKSIKNVHLVGDSQVIQVGGQPTMEQYDFIARGTDEQLSSLV